MIHTTILPDQRQEAASFVYQQKRDTDTMTARPYHNLTAPHKILLWPVVYAHLRKCGVREAADLAQIKREGTPWLLRKEIAKHPQPLSKTSDLRKTRVKGAALIAGLSTRFTFPTLDPQKIQRFTAAYFDTFNALAPILDEDTFSKFVMQPLSYEVYAGDDQKAVLAFTVLALGQVAIEGAFGNSSQHASGPDSGWLGGSMDSPPGLGFLNEARRRIEMVPVIYTLASVQILLLHATYYGTCARHLEYWRCSQEASLACQAFIHCTAIDWSSYEGDMIKRVYWACLSNEMFFHRDLDMPQSSLRLMQDWIQLPEFWKDSNEAQQDTNAPSDNQFRQEHFLALISLSRLAQRVDVLLHQGESPDHQGESPDHECFYRC